MSRNWISPADYRRMDKVLVKKYGFSDKSIFRPECQEVVGEVNQAEIATVERLRREGKGLSAIAQETGISMNTYVCRKRNSCGI